MGMECVSKDLARNLTSSLTKGHTQERSHVCVGSVGGALASSQPSSDTSGPTQERSHMCAGSVGGALARSLTSTDIREPSLAITPFHKSCFPDLSFPFALSVQAVEVTRKCFPFLHCSGEKVLHSFSDKRVGLCFPSCTRNVC